MTGKVTASAHLRGINPGPPPYTAKKSRGGVAMRTLIDLGILVVLLVTAIILSASTFSPFSNSSRFFRRLSVAESPPNTPISHTCEEQYLHITCLPAIHLQRCLMKSTSYCQRHQPCLFPATIIPHAMLASLASVLSVVIMLAPHDESSYRVMDLLGLNSPTALNHPDEHRGWNHGHSLIW